MAPDSKDSQPPEARRALSVALLVGLAVVVGLALWMVRGGGGGDGGDARSDAAVTADGGGAGSLSGAQKRAKGAKPDLATAAKAAVSGTVRDPEGRAIADAQVCAMPNQGRLEGLRVRELPCTTTGPDGYYRLEGLWPVPTAVHASAAEHQPRRWIEQIDGRWEGQLELVAGQTREQVDIVLPTGGALVEGVIKDIAGGAIEGAEVQVEGSWMVRGRARGSAVGRTDAEGAFAIWASPGDVMVSARIEGYAEGSTPARAPGEFVELFLTPESVLVGRVVHAQTGEGVAGATVDSGGRFAPAGSGLGTARTDEQGNFRIDGLAPGTFKPTAESDSLRGEAAEQVHLGLGETSSPVEIRVHPGGYVEGQVVIASATGEPEPCAGGNVSLSMDHQESYWQPIEAEGMVHFRGVLPGTYRVSVSCTDMLSEETYAELEVGTEPEALVGLVWEVREGLAIRGEVVDSTGQPVDEVRVVARALQDPKAAKARRVNQGTQSNPDGSFELGGLLPGRYELDAGEGWRGQAGPEEPTIIELEGGDVSGVRIEMPVTGTVRGVVVDENERPVSGASVVANQTGAYEASRGRTDDEGRFELLGVRVGEVRVEAQASASFFGGQSMRAPGTTDDDVQGEVVAVRADAVAEVRLVVESRDGRIQGRVVDQDGGPVVDAFVEVERMSDRAGASMAQARRRVRWSWDSEPVLTDPDGAFEIGELAEGRFLVRAHRRGGGEAVVEGVEVGSTVELVIESPGELAGTVIVEGGEPPERFELVVRDAEQGTRYTDSFLRTGGAWRLSRVSAGSYEISVSSAQGTATTEVELGAGEVREGIELRLSPRIELSGRLVDIDSGEPVPGGTVIIRSRSRGRAAPDPDRGNVSGADGRFVLHEVPPGQVMVTVFFRGAGQEGRYTGGNIARTIEPEPLEQDLGDIELVRARMGPGERGGDLGFTLESRKPGVDPGESKQIVAFIRPGGPATATELAVGDVIERVDGHEVGGEYVSRWYALTQVAPGTKLSLGVAGGKTVELVVGEAL